MPSLFVPGGATLTLADSQNCDLGCKPFPGIGQGFYFCFHMGKEHLLAMLSHLSQELRSRSLGDPVTGRAASVQGKQPPEFPRTSETSKGGLFSFV